ncbi:MAG: hypothetical protein AB7V46_17235 [Thermomicrobiales bacterium]
MNGYDPTVGPHTLMSDKAADLMIELAALITDARMCRRGKRLTPKQFERRVSRLLDRLKAVNYTVRGNRAGESMVDWPAVLLMTEKRITILAEEAARP